jgi:hypothetical protein
MIMPDWGSGDDRVDFTHLAGKEACGLMIRGVQDPRAAQRAAMAYTVDPAAGMTVSGDG